MTTISVEKAEAACELLEQRLVGAQLDTFRTYGVLLQLGFLPASQDQPPIWLNCMSTLSRADLSPQRSDGTDEAFRQSRVRAVATLQEAIGGVVTDVAIGADGGLTITLDKNAVRISGDEREFEEVWYVTGGGPDLYGDPDWYVALSSDGELSVKKTAG